MSDHPTEPALEPAAGPGAASVDAPIPASPRTARHRPWAPTVVVVLVLFATVFGGYVAASALSEPVGAPVSIEGLIQVQPLSGWEFAGRFSTAGAQGIRLTRGGGNLDVLAAPVQTDPQQLARNYVDVVLRPEAQPGSFSIEQGLEGTRVGNAVEAVTFSYIGEFERNGTPIEGEVTVLVSPSGTGIVYDAWAPQSLLQFIRGDTETMQDAAVVT